MNEKLTKAFDNYKGEEKRTEKIVFQYPFKIPRENDTIQIYEIRKGKLGYSIVAGVNEGDKGPMPITILNESQQTLILKYLESKAQNN